MNRVLSLAALVPKTCVRRLATTEVRSADSALAKIRKKQMHFQRDSDEPVYLKGGAMDHVLYYLTAGVILVSLAATFHSTYKLANKK